MHLRRTKITEQFTCTSVLVLLIASALAGEVKVGALRVEVYAPEWTWQNRDVNILLVAKNEGASPETLEVTLELPDSAEKAQGPFAYGGPRRRLLTLEPGRTLRAAFVDLRARERAPLGEHSVRLRFRARERATEISLRVRVIRGSLVSSGRWALYLPIGIAAGWCGLFVLILRKESPPGSWKQPVVFGGESSDHGD